MKDKAAKAAYDREYRQKNKTRLVEKNREYVERNKERRRKYQTEYYRNRLRADPEYRARNAAQARVWRKTSTTYKEWVAEYRKSDSYKLCNFRSLLKNIYGITVDTYDAMLREQGGVCGLCSSPPAPNRRLAIDHCHRTNRIRGLLCHRCNLRLGVIERYLDDPDAMNRWMCR